MDLLIGGRGGSAGRPNFLFENQLGAADGWIGFKLEGDGTNINRDAVGTRVTLECGDYSLMREVKTSRGMYNSMDMRKLHFGLGGFDCDFSVVVDWPDGTSHTFEYSDVNTGEYQVISYPDTITAL